MRKRLNNRKRNSILRYRKLGLSYREIQRLVCCALSTVFNYVNEAR